MKLTATQQANAIVKLAAVHRNTRDGEARIKATTLVVKVSDNNLTDTEVSEMASLLETHASRQADKYVRPSMVRQKLFARELAHVQR